MLVSLGLGTHSTPREAIKGSGFNKGLYSANRSEGRSLNYEYDTNLKRIGSI